MTCRLQCPCGLILWNRQMLRLHVSSAFLKGTPGHDPLKAKYSDAWEAVEDMRREMVAEPEPPPMTRCPVCDGFYQDLLRHAHGAMYRGFRMKEHRGLWLRIKGPDLRFSDNLRRSGGEQN